MIRARQISNADLTRIAELLARGFPRRSRAEWLKCLHRMTIHGTPSGFPKYGYLLEDGEIAVGVLLLISSTIRIDVQPITRCNLSSWYVDPGYRCYATLMAKHAVRTTGVTYCNVSPAKHTLPILKAQGFTRYSAGQFAAIPLPVRPANAERVEVQGIRTPREYNGEPWERELLIRHAEYGCLSVRCVTPKRDYPFVFRQRFVRGFLPCLQLVFSRDLEEFRRFAWALGTFFGLRGRPMILIDSNGPIRGVTGKYFEGAAPKFFKGLHQPRLGDLAYTEIAVFGI